MHTPDSSRRTILLISPYWKEEHRWMVSSVKLAELWQRMGYRLVVVCMGSESSIEEVSETLTIHRRKDIFLPDPLNFGIAFGFAGYVRRLIKLEKPDHIIVNKVLFWTSFSLIPLRLIGYKVLLLTDALVGITWWPRKLLPKILMGIGAWTVGWLVLLCAERIVTFHPQPEHILKKLGIAKKTQVIPTGIDVTRYEVRGTSEGPATRNEQPVTDLQPVTISYIGRLESVKGVDDFLHALVPLKKEFPQLKLQVVGWYKDNHPLVQQFDREVIFTGLRHDIPEILSETDIFVLPSYSEGLSNALMEAMASGCACVATEVGGNRYLIQNGVSGFLFTPGDHEALRAHVRRLIEDSAKRVSVSTAARKRLEEIFDWSVIAKHYETLFSQTTHA